MFNGNTPISTHFHSDFLSFIWSCDHVADRQHSTSAEAKVVPQVHSADFHPSVNYVWHYYASFMEFLLDKTRSEEHWFEDQYCYTTLATKVLCIFKDLYVMNGISHSTLSTTDDISCCKLVDERISRVWGLLHVFLDETFPSNECLMFQDELFYNALCKYVSKWCKSFEPLLEVIGEFEGILEEFWLFFIDWVGMVYNLF